MADAARGVRGRYRRAVVLATLVLAAGWTLHALAYQVTTLRAYKVPTNSMAPTIRGGDSVQVDVEPPGRDPRRGEIWIFRPPPAARAAGTFIKRVVGLPGETVEVRTGRVRIDGTPLVEPYLMAAPTYAMPPRRLGPGEFFVLGDNRNACQDSHTWGPVPRDHFLGRARFRYWPPSRLGGL